MPCVSAATSATPACIWRKEIGAEQQIFRWIPRQHQFGEHDQVSVLLTRLMDGSLHLAEIVLNIPHTDVQLG